MLFGCLTVVPPNFLKQQNVCYLEKNPLENFNDVFLYKIKRYHFKCPLVLSDKNSLTFGNSDEMNKGFL